MTSAPQLIPQEPATASVRHVIPFANVPNSLTLHSATGSGRCYVSAPARVTAPHRAFVRCGICAGAKGDADHQVIAEVCSSTKARGEEDASTLDGCVGAVLAGVWEAAEFGGEDRAVEHVVAAVEVA